MFFFIRNYIIMYSERFRIRKVTRFCWQGKAHLTRQRLLTPRSARTPMKPSSVQDNRSLLSLQPLVLGIEPTTNVVQFQSSRLTNSEQRKKLLSVLEAASRMLDEDDFPLEESSAGQRSFNARACANRHKEECSRD